MKILPLSDLHNDFYRYHPDHSVPDLVLDEPVDLILFAGDIDTGTHGIEWAIAQCDRLGVPGVYVPGNHELYRRVYQDAIEQMRQAAKNSSVTFLHNDSTIINGTQIIGATLWTDFGVHHDNDPMRHMDFAQKNLSDYKEIGFNDYGQIRHISPEDTLELHYASLDYIESQLERFDNLPTLIVSHHAPHMNSVAEHRKEKGEVPAYASDLTFLFQQYDIDLWIHGHTHNKSDYTLFGTSVYANPRGNFKELPDYKQEVIRFTPNKNKLKTAAATVTG